MDIYDVPNGIGWARRFSAPAWRVGETAAGRSMELAGTANRGILLNAGHLPPQIDMAEILC